MEFAKLIDIARDEASAEEFYFYKRAYLQSHIEN